MRWQSSHLEQLVEVEARALAHAPRQLVQRVTRASVEVAIDIDPRERTSERGVTGEEGAEGLVEETCTKHRIDLGRLAEKSGCQGREFDLPAAYLQGRLPQTP